MVDTPPQTDTYSTALDIFDRTHPLRVDADENLKVTGTFIVTPSGTQDVNIVSTITIPVSGTFFQATQPVSLTSTTITGTVAVTQSTSPWVVSGSITTSPNVNVHDGLGNTIASTGTSLNVDVTNTVPVTGTFFQTTQPISGTVTTVPPANASTNLTEVGGAALAEGQTTMANSVPVVIASNQTAIPVSGTVTITPSGTQNENLIQVAGVTLGATAVTNYGTAPAAAAVPGVNAFITNTPAVTLASTTITGNVTVVQPTGSNFHIDVDNFPATQPISGSVSVSNFPATQPISGTVTANQGTANTLANAWPVEVTDGTNILGTATHPVRIDPTGTTTQPISGTVTANIGTTNGLALNQTLVALILAQGSTTSGLLGPFVQGAVTTSAPTYSTGTIDPLSLTTAGALRVDGSGVTQPVSGTVTVSLANTITTGSTASIGTSAVQIHSGSIAATTGVTIRCSTLNTDLIYFGISTVTANTTAATDGVPLKPGESITMPVTNINLIYGISPTAGQKVFWMVL